MSEEEIRMLLLMSGFNLRQGLKNTYEYKSNTQIRVVVRIKKVEVTVNNYKNFTRYEYSEFQAALTHALGECNGNIS
ncbi:MAG: hypothetical protein HRU18_02695 [Pseudoalteromonas sp.]|uniref:hypothetical protein n=1 Tax=Pseudoalteromonas sp. TaxID=53249 RepID=UPI001D6198DB|nr:hypothetical protein [Pseudoalteromonas sp.]NRA77092.1 hypothetical protein [Pseudoalteromonas sp.]